MFFVDLFEAIVPEINLPILFSIVEFGRGYPKTKTFSPTVRFLSSPIVAFLYSFLLSNLKISKSTFFIFLIDFLFIECNSPSNVIIKFS